MISMPNLTQSPISQSLTDAQRENLIELVSERYLQSMDGRDLERFFLDIQGEYLAEYTDAELLEEVDNVLDNEEYQEVLNAIVN